MTIIFHCPSEQLMFRTRESMSPRLRRLDVKFGTHKNYPTECHKFSLPIPFEAEYGMEYDIQLDPTDPRWNLVCEIAHNVAESISAEIRLDIDN